MSHLSKEDRTLIRERLTKKIARSLSKIAQMEDMSQPISPENSIGRISRMDAINNKSVMEAALRNARKDLDGMNNALSHVDDDDFGLCKRCAEQIPLQRLMLMPGSTRCVNCA